MTKPSSATRRFLALWFPFLAADRWQAAWSKAGQRIDVTPPDTFAIVEKQHGALRLVALSPAAAALGLAPGMALANARAQLPGLAIFDHDPLADRLWLGRIADACVRYTPMTALDPPDGLVLDITGCTHLFSDEVALAADIEGRFAGLHFRHACAGTPEAAQALARFQTVPAASEAAAIRRLPVASLRLNDETETALRRAGLGTIGDLADRPTAPLAARFGAAASGALDRLLGRTDSRITPRRALSALIVERRFAEPIARTEAALAIVDDLIAEASAEMERKGLGGRRFAARFYRSDGVLADLAVETSLPVRDPALVIRLFRERIDALADPIDPGFGFDMIRLAVPVLETLTPLQLALEGGATGEKALADLIDRLSVRLGRDRVRRFSPRDSHLPEQAAFDVPAADARTAAPWPVPKSGEPSLRPLHLFDPPQSIEVIADVPDGPPRRFRWRRNSHDVTRHEGPERIAAEWWHLKSEARFTRDYYRIEDACGRRFWIFRHGIYGSESTSPRWYIHGLFA